MIVVGIDPGESSGFARYEDGKLVNLWTLKPLNAIQFLIGQDASDGALFAMEDSRLQSFIFDRGVNAASKLKIARNVGQVDGLCALYAEALGKNKLIKVSPLNKGKKITDSIQFNNIFGWGKRSNQHERDGAMVAWPFRHGAK